MHGMGRGRACSTVSGGVPRSRLLGRRGGRRGRAIGSTRRASASCRSATATSASPTSPNTDVLGTLREAIDRVNAAARRRLAFMLHTGDMSHFRKPAAIRHRRADPPRDPGSTRTTSPANTTCLSMTGRPSSNASQAARRRAGTASITGRALRRPHERAALKAGGLGDLGAEQLDWLQPTSRAVPASHPIVVFAHVPLWAVYQEWGWGTEDGEQALAFLRRFGSVTVLNGHIHQIMQKVEGNVTFHTASSTAFPQPAPGTAASPGPIRICRPAGCARPWA